MKSIKILIATVLLFLFICIVTYASDGSFIIIEKDIENSVVTITGNVPSKRANEILTVLVLNPEKTVDDLPQDENAVQKQTEIITGVNGSFRLEFTLYLTEYSIPGYYEVYIGGEEFENPAESRFYYATPDDMNDAIADLNTIIKDGQNVTKEQMEKKLIEYKDVLSFSFPPFDVIQKINLAEKLLNKVKTTPFSTHGDIQAWVKENALVEAYNQSKLAVIYGSDNEFLYP